MIRDAASIVVLASRNKGKIKELAILLEPFGVTLHGLDEYPAIGEIEETGSTFEENALLKARTVAEKTGYVSIADDSGLEVDALDGAPGVYSARFSAAPGFVPTDASNNAKLLAALHDVPSHQRTARFRCAMAAAAPPSPAAPEGRHIIASGFWEGRILTELRGQNGFGYDPLFCDPVLGNTAAEISIEEKNSRSHRARAVRNLMDLWPAFWQEYMADME